jgi:hypothetical protein
MKTTLRAAIAALSIASISPAIAAGSEGGPAANTRFTSLPDVIAQAPVRNTPAVATMQNGQALRTDNQPGHGPWLFPPIGKYLDQPERG